MSYFLVKVNDGCFLATFFDVMIKRADFSRQRCPRRFSVKRSSINVPVRLLSSSDVAWETIYNFRDTINPLCPSNDGIEDSEHFLLPCTSFAEPRRELLTGVLALLRPYGYVKTSSEALMKVLLYGDKNLPNDLNKSILLLTLNFMHKTGRLD